MKKLFTSGLIVTLLLGLCSCEQIKEQRIEQLIQDYMRQNLCNRNSYEPLTYEIVEAEDAYHVRYTFRCTSKHGKTITRTCLFDIDPKLDHIIYVDQRSDKARERQRERERNHQSPGNLIISVHN